MPRPDEDRKRSSQPTSTSTAIDSKRTGEDSGKKQSSEEVRKSCDGDRSRREESSSKSTKSTEERDAERSEKVVVESINSHLGFLATPLLTLSTHLSIPPLSTILLLSLIYFAALLYLPPIFTPYLSSLITFFIPFHNSYRILRGVIHSSRAGMPTEGIQWTLYWVIWVLLEGLRGLLGVYRPGWRGWFEVWRVGWLVVIGGPWFARDRLRSSPSSDGSSITSDERRKQAEREMRKRAEQSRGGSGSGSSSSSDEKRKQAEREARRRAEQGKEGRSN